MTTLEQILEYYEDDQILIADGFDEAVLGIEESSMRLIYSASKMVDCLIADGMTQEDAIEYLSYNVFGAYVGERTPIWCMDF